MPIKQVACHVVVCDVCGALTEDDDHVMHYDTPADAAKAVEVHGWGRAGDLIICPSLDDPHSQAVSAAGVSIPVPISGVDVGDLLTEARPPRCKHGVLTLDADGTVWTCIADPAAKRDPEATCDCEIDIGEDGRVIDARPCLCAF